MLCSFWSLLYAQENGLLLDKVFLKSGRTYTGQIIEQVPGVSLKILRYPDQDTAELKMPDVARIVKMNQPDALPAERVLPVRKSAGRFPEKEPELIVQSGYFYSSRLSGTSVGATVGMRMSPDYFVGMGLTYYGESKTQEYPLQLVPVFLEGRVLLAEWKSVSMQLATQAGHLFNKTRTVHHPSSSRNYRDGGFMMNSSLSWRMKLKVKSELLIDAGYLYMLDGYWYAESGNNGKSYYVSMNRNFLSLKLGLLI